MHPDIDHRSAALQRLLPKHSPVRNASSAQSATFDKHDVSELPFVTGAEQKFGVVVISLLESDGEFALVLLGDLHHLLALFDVHSHRFFRDGMAAGVERVDHGRSMNAVRRTDVHRIGFDLLEHDLPVLEERLLRQSPLALHHIQSFLENIDARDDFHFRNPLVGLHMRLRDSSASDNRHAKFLPLVLLFLRVHCKRLGSYTFIERHLKFSFVILVSFRRIFHLQNTVIRKTANSTG